MHETVGVPLRSAPTMCCDRHQEGFELSSRADPVSAPSRTSVHDHEVPAILSQRYETLRGICFGCR
jgi:hypothetical protein